MAFRIKFNEEKNQILKANRSVCFDDVLDAIENDNVLADIKHSSDQYPYQRIYVVKFKNYIYAVPYVINNARKEIFLKTIYPSRKLTKQYLKRSKE